MSKRPVSVDEGVEQLTEQLYQHAAENGQRVLHDKIDLLIQNDPKNEAFYEAMRNTVDNLVDIVAQSGKLVQVHSALASASKKELNRVRRRYAVLLNAMRTLDDGQPEVANMMFDMVERMATDPDLQAQMYCGLIERVSATLGVNAVMAAQFMAVFNGDGGYFPEHIEEALVGVIRTWAEDGFPVEEGS
jgi:hypothetical protein